VVKDTIFFLLLKQRSLPEKQISKIYYNKKKRYLKEWGQTIKRLKIPCITSLMDLTVHLIIRRLAGDIKFNILVFNRLYVDTSFIYNFLIVILNKYLITQI